MVCSVTSSFSFMQELSHWVMMARQRLIVFLFEPNSSFQNETSDADKLKPNAKLRFAPSPKETTPLVGFYSSDLHTTAKS